MLSLSDYRQRLHILENEEYESQIQDIIMEDHPDAHKNSKCQSRLTEMCSINDNIFGRLQGHLAERSATIPKRSDSLHSDGFSKLV